LHLFDQVPFGLKREDLKLFGDLGGLAVATALIALVLFVLQGFLRLGSPLVALMDRVFPVTIRQGREIMPNELAMTYIAAAVAEEERTPELLCRAYFVFRGQDGLTRPAVEDDAHYKYLQDRFSGYYALQGKMLLFCAGIVLLCYVPFRPPGFVVAGDAHRLLMLLVGVAVVAFVIRCRISKDLARWQENLFPSALEKSALWAEPIKKAAAEWPKPSDSAVRAVLYYQELQEGRVTSLREHLFRRLTRSAFVREIEAGLGPFCRLHRRMLNRAFAFASGDDDSWIAGYICYRYLFAVARLQGRFHIPQDKTEAPSD
jgi:hypothetical protein